MEALHTDETLSKVKVNKRYLATNYHDSSSQFPNEYQWPAYFPASSVVEREPSHTLVIGQTGSSKTQRVMNMLFAPSKYGGLYYDSIWYVSDMTSPLALKIKD